MSFLRTPIVGWPRWTLEATFTAASHADYPASNLQVWEPLDRIWRSPDLDEENTSIVATFAEAVPVRLVVLVRHNLSFSARCRLRVWADTACTILLYDSGWEKVWRRRYRSRLLPWRAKNWWSGAPLLRQVRAQTWNKRFWLAQTYKARAVQLDLSDPANPQGSVDAGLMEICQGFQCSIGHEFGGAYAFRSRSKVIQGDGGAKATARKRIGRTWRGEIRGLPREEMFATFADLAQNAELVEPFWWEPDVGAEAEEQQLAFFAANGELNPFEYAYVGHDNIGLALEEWL